MKIPFSNYEFSFGRNIKESSRSFLTGNGWESLTLGKTKSGVSVTKQNALTIAAFYAGVRVYADAISMLPKGIIKEQNGSKIKDKKHPLYKLVSSEPNALMTNFVLWQIIIPQIILWGNGVCVIEFEKGSHRPKSIIPVHFSRVKINLMDGILVYSIKIDGQKDLVLDQSNILHFRGLGDEIVGKSVLDYAADSLGVGKAAEDFGGAFFGNGANMGGILSTDQILSDSAIKNIRDSWNKNNGGISNAQKTAILEQGLKFQAMTVPPDSAQFLETRKFSVTDVARWLKLPPHVLGDLERATFSNIEQQDLNLVKHSILPYVVNIEQELNRKLLRETEKGTYYFKMNLEGLLRGDITTRVDAYTKLIQNGVMTPNEVRAKEDMNPLDGLDSTWMQTNTAPVIDGTNQQEKTEVEKIEVEPKTETDEENNDK